MDIGSAIGCTRREAIRFSCWAIARNVPFQFSVNEDAVGKYTHLIGLTSETVKVMAEQGCSVFNNEGE